MIEQFKKLPWSIQIIVLLLSFSSGWYLYNLLQSIVAIGAGTGSIITLIITLATLVIVYGLVMHKNWGYWGIFVIYTINIIIAIVQTFFFIYFITQVCTNSTDDIDPQILPTCNHPNAVLITISLRLFFYFWFLFSLRKHKPLFFPKKDKTEIENIS